MASKTLKTRILLKTDTTANWEKAANSFIPKEGEVCIYSDRFQLEDGTYVPGIKVGDGSSYINELEFMGDDYISNEEIDEIFNAPGVNLEKEYVTLTFPQMGEGHYVQCTMIYVGSLNENNLPIYKNFFTPTLENHSYSFRIIKNSCFYVGMSALIEEAYSYTGPNLIRIDNGENSSGTYQIIGDVTFAQN